MSVEDAILHLTSLPRSARCSPRCPGWCVAETNRHPLVEIEVCDECNSAIEEHFDLRLYDEDVAQIPAARRALARYLTAGSRLRGRALTRARKAALREHDLYTALSNVLAWTDTTPDPPVKRLERIREIVTEAIDTCAPEVSS